MAVLGKEGEEGEEEFAEKRLTTTTTVPRQVVQNFQTKFFVQNSKSFSENAYVFSCIATEITLVGCGAKMFWNKF
jgi:hypothetical protein